MVRSWTAGWWWSLDPLQQMDSLQSRSTFASDTWLSYFSLDYRSWIYPLNHSWFHSLKLIIRNFHTAAGLREGWSGRGLVWLSSIHPFCPFNSQKILEKKRPGTLCSQTFLGISNQHISPYQKPTMLLTHGSATLCPSKSDRATGRSGAAEDRTIHSPHTLRQSDHSIFCKGLVIFTSKTIMQSFYHSLLATLRVH